MYKCKGCGREYEQPPNYNKCDSCGCDVSYVDTENRYVRKHVSKVLGKTADESDINSDRPLPKSSSDECNDDGVEAKLPISPQGLESDRNGKVLGPHQSNYTRVLQRTEDGFAETEMTDAMLEEMIAKDIPEGVMPPLYVCITPKCFKLFKDWNEGIIKRIEGNVEDVVELYPAYEVCDEKTHISIQSVISKLEGKKVRITIEEVR